MDWKFLGNCLWHGLSAAVITGGTTIGALQQWPTKLQWLILISGAVVAGFKGIQGYFSTAP